MKIQIAQFRYLNFPKQYNSILFWTWTLLRACIHTWDFFPKKISSDTSFPLGRQCKKIQFLFAKPINFLSILNFLNAWIFFFLLTIRVLMGIFSFFNISYLLSKFILKLTQSFNCIVCNFQSFYYILFWNFFRLTLNHTDIFIRSSNH